MNSLPGGTPAAQWILDEPVAALVRRKARVLARSPGFSRSDQPDIEQELRLHLLQKAPHFNADRAQRTTFAQRLIENKAASLARGTAAQKRSYRRNCRSLNEVVTDGQGPGTELANLLDTSAARRHTGQRPTEPAHLRLDLADANRELPLPLKRLAALLSHVSPFAAGEILGISRRQVRRQVAELRDRYAARGLGV